MYKIGEIFKIKYESPFWRENFERYILAQVEAGQVNLVSLETGNRFTNTIHVEDVFGISKEEFEKLIPLKYTVQYYNKKQKKYNFIQVSNRKV